MDWMQGISKSVSQSRCVTRVVDALCDLFSAPRKCEGGLGGSSEADDERRRRVDEARKSEPHHPPPTIIPALMLWKRKASAKTTLRFLHNQVEHLIIQSLA